MPALLYMHDKRNIWFVLHTYDYASVLGGLGFTGAGAGGGGLGNG